VVVLNLFLIRLTETPNYNNMEDKKIQQNNIYIVLVHGYQGNPSNMDTAKKFFQDNNYTNVHAFDYSKTTSHHIARNASLLFEWLKENNPTNNKIVLIGFSMGGLVIRKLALDYHPTLDIFKLVTLATPNYGAHKPE